MNARIVETHRNRDLSDEEIRRRLAAAYRLLLSLGTESKNDAPACDPGKEPADASGDTSLADQSVPTAGMIAPNQRKHKQEIE